MNQIKQWVENNIYPEPEENLTFAEVIVGAVILVGILALTILALIALGAN